MPPTYTLNTNVTTTDKSSRVFNKIEKSFKRMTGAFSRQTKRAVVSLNNLNAKVNRTARNIGKKLGGLGRLGLGIGFLAIATTIIDANIQVDKSFASLSAITGVTGEAFNNFTDEINKVSKAEKIFSADTAKAFELVGSAKPELLSSASALAEVATNAIILSKAADDELAASVANLTNVLNQFELGADQSARAMNVLAAASVVGDTKITQTSQAFKVAGSEAKMSGLNIEELSGTIATFSKFGFKGAEAGTKFRNILSKMSLGDALPKDALTRLKAAGVNIDLISNKTIPYIDRLKELSKIQNNSAALSKTFGEENKGVAAILLSNIPLLEQNIKGVKGTNAATEQAAIKANTFSNRLDEITASFKNSITATKEQGGQMQSLKDIMAFVADNMDTIIAGVIVALKIFAAYKIIMAAASVVTWAFNSALLANPITWIIVGIVALIAAIAALIVYWQDIVTWVKESDNAFAKFIRFAMYPLVILFKAVGSAISLASSMLSDFIGWVKTSDSWFAGFIRTAIDLLSEFVTVLGVVWDGIVWLMEKAIEPLIEGFEKLGEVIDFFSSETQKELGVDLNKNVTTSNKEKVEVVTTSNKEDKIIQALDLNSTELDKNTNASKKEWKGKFSTSILKDANIPNSAIKTAQREISISGIAREFKNTSIQNSIINNNTQSGPAEVVTPFTSSGTTSENVNSSKKSNNNSSQQIDITVHDKTGGNYELEVESTGLEVNTTGN